MTALGFTVFAPINSHGLYWRFGVKKPLISKKNRRSRLQFTHNYLTWSPQIWNTILFRTESKFQIFRSNGWKTLFLVCDWFLRCSGFLVNLLRIFMGFSFNCFALMILLVGWLVSTQLTAPKSEGLIKYKILKGRWQICYKSF